MIQYNKKEKKTNIIKKKVHLEEWINIPINIKPTKVTTAFRCRVQSNFLLQFVKTKKYYALQIIKIVKGASEKSILF